MGFDCTWQNTADHGHVILAEDLMTDSSKLMTDSSKLMTDSSKLRR